LTLVGDLPGSTHRPITEDFYMIAKTTADGTAAAEAALCDVHDTVENRERLAREADTDVTGPWVRTTSNDELECQICGAKD
jgi:hypothetical protein